MNDLKFTLHFICFNPEVKIVDRKNLLCSTSNQFSDLLLEAPYSIYSGGTGTH
jgi:hypothetical protein